MGEQRLHGRIEAVALRELDGEAFGESRAPTPGGSKRLDEPRTRLDDRADSAPSRSATASSCRSR